MQGKTFPPEMRAKFTLALAEADIRNLEDVAVVALDCVGYFDLTDSPKIQAMRAVVDAARGYKDTDGNDWGAAGEKLFKAIQQWEKFHCKYYRQGVCSEGTCQAKNVCCFDCADWSKCCTPCPAACTEGLPA